MVTHWAIDNLADVFLYAVFQEGKILGIVRRFTGPKGGDRGIRWICPPYRTITPGEMKNYTVKRLVVNFAEEV
jgi:hypothetical protein